MKRLLAACALVFLLPMLAHAQNPGPQGPMMFSKACSSSTRYGMAYLCYDTALNSFYSWVSGTGFVAISPTFGTVKASKLCANATPATGCTTNAVAGDVGAAKASGGQYWFGTGNNASLSFDSATGAFTLAGPTGGDLLISNGGVQIAARGLASCPTCAAGTLGHLCYVNDGNNACTLDVVITSGGSKNELGFCSHTGGTYHYLAATCE